MKKIITIALFALFAMFILQANAQQVEKSSKVRVLLNGQSIEKVGALGLEVFNEEYKKDVSFLGIYNQNELELLKQAGFDYEMLIQDMTEYYIQRNKSIDLELVNQNLKIHTSSKNYVTPENFSLGSMAGYHTYAEILSEMDQMRLLFPNLISQKTSIGLFQSIQGRPIHYVRISNNPDVMQEKPKVLYTALMHAREPAGLQQMLYQMWYLLENYANNPEIQYLIDNVEMYFIPCLNPDGYVYNQTTNPNGGGMHRKNMRVNSDNSFGVDLNRNFGYMWGYDNSGSSGTPSSMTYRGTAPFSEPENQALKHFCETIPFKLALNNHTYSDLLIYPWGYADQLTPDGDIFVRFAQLLTEENNYTYGTCYQTLNYFVNGGSDDWMYGEQTTKEKIFAFTPEAGSPADGFWPAVNRIEEICAGHTGMNMNLARLALKYARLKPQLPKFISSKQGHIPFTIECLGLDVPASFTVSIEPLSSNMIQIGDTKVFDNMTHLQLQLDSISYTLHPGTASGSEVSFVIKLSNGEFTWNDTIHKVYGQVEYVINDPCNTMQNWTSTTWNITTQSYYSAPASITDSPSGQYPNNANTHITTSQIVDLSDCNMAFAEFYAKWDIETGWDYVQFLASTNNGQTWIPLAGNYTVAGGSNQAVGQPLYHGVQSSWVKEEVSLDDFVGQQILLRFRLISDGYITKDGFYFDDFKVFKMSMSNAPMLFLPDSIGFYQNQSIEVNLQNYLSGVDLNTANFSWSNNNNIQLALNNWNLIISCSDENWIGDEMVLFTLESDGQTVDQEVKISCKKINTVPVITGQLEVKTGKNQPKLLSLDYLVVDDDDNTFPDDYSLILLQGENFTISAPLTILPATDFTGMLSVPVKVSDGTDESEVFNLQVEVIDGLSVDLTKAGKPSVSYSNQGVLNIRNLESYSKASVIRVFDIVGKQVAEAEIMMGSTEHQMEVKLKPGVYILQITGSQVATVKFSVNW